MLPVNSLLFFTKIYTIISRKIQNFRFILCIIVLILLTIYLGHLVPIEYKVIFYTFSYLMTSCMTSILPILLFPFIVHSFMQIKGNIAYITFIILITTFISNFVSILFSYLISIKFLPLLNNINISYIRYNIEYIKSIYTIDFPVFINLPTIIILGMITGITLGKFHFDPIIKFMTFYFKISKYFFEKIFISLLPLYILGIMLKMNHEIDFSSLLLSFGKIIIITMIILYTYIILLFFIGSKYNVPNTLCAIKNSITAGIVAISTMSSIITMPLTIKAAEKNTNCSKLSNITITTTVNSHVIGDCITLPLIAISIIYVITSQLPSFSEYFYFAFIAALSQFSAISVPGGSVTIMLPVLTTKLGFTSEMTGILVSLYICLDPLSTAGNVMGNSAFVMIINNIYCFITKNHFFNKLKFS